MLDAPMFNRLVAVAQKQDVGLIVGGVLGQGFFTELYTKNVELAKQLLENDDEKKRLRGTKLLRLYEISDQSGMPVLEMALRYVKSIGEIHCHIPGARSEAHIIENMKIYEKGKLPKDLLDAIIAVRSMERV